MVRPFQLPISGMGHAFMWTLSVAIIAISTYCLFAYSANVPFWDDYAFFHFLDDYYSNPTRDNFLSVLFRFHNEHRIVLPKLLVYLDHLFFTDISFQRLCLYGYIGLLVLLKLLHDHYRSTEILLIMCVIMFMPKLEIHFWALGNLSNVLVYPFIIGAYVLLYQKLDAKSIITAHVLCVIALFTSGVGILSFVFAYLFLIKRKADIWSPRVIAWTVFSVIFYVLYFTNYKVPEGHLGVAENLTTRLIDIVKYFLFLVSSVIKVPPQIASLRYAIGFVPVLLFIWTLWRLKWRIFDHRLSLSICLYMFALSAVIALSRVGFGVQQALSERYEMVSGLIWIAVLGLAYKSNALRKWHIQTMLGLFVLHYVLSFNWSTNRIKFHHSNQKAAAIGYKYRMGDMLLFPAPNAALKWLDRNIERGHYVNPEYLTMAEVNSIKEDIPAVSSKVIAAWGGGVNTQNGIVKYAGWAVLDHVNSENIDIKIVFSKAGDNYIFPTIAQVRQDVTDHLKHKVNYNNAGFLFVEKIDDLGLEPGEYKVGLLLAQKSEKYYHTKDDILKIANWTKSIKTVDLESMLPEQLVAAFGVNQKEGFLIEGWGFLSEAREAKTDKYVIFKFPNELKGYIFKADEVYRPDVTKHLNDGGNYDFSGFKLSFDPSKIDIPKGKYQLGFYLTDGTNSSYRLIEEFYDKE